MDKFGKINSKIGKYRWTICGLIFFATTVNYLDRQVISLLKPVLEKEFNWSETDYSNIVIAFQIAYAIGFAGAGRIIDKIGTKLGYAMALTFWSMSAIAHAFAKTTFGFGVARAALGLSEGGNWPAAVKTVAEWFPKKERALATGIFNSGANIGAILAPILVPLIVVKWGWQEAFVITGAVGFIWLIFWFIYYEHPTKLKKLSKTELDHIQSDREDNSFEEKQDVSWKKLLGYKQAWAFMLGKFLTDPIWWFLLFWLPSFLQNEYGMTGTQVSIPLALIYTMSAVGSIWGGWLSGYLINRGLPVYKARKQSMLLFALCIVPVIAAQALGKINPWMAIAVIGVATICHQGWSANIYTISSDMFPKKAVATIVGLGGMAGAVGGILIARIAGVLLDHFKSSGHIETGYYIMFIISGTSYLLAWVILHLLAPRMEKVKIS
jgi:ACS family hexuronate transporter-like MFS transporter